MTTLLEFRKILALNKVYSLHCKGLCQDSCGPITTSKKEAEEIREYCKKNNLVYTELSHERVFQILSQFEKDKDADKTFCPYLNRGNGKCNIYSVRPMICRLWGSVDSELMRCQYGCKPELGYITQRQASLLLDRQIKEEVSDMIETVKKQLSETENAMVGT